MLLEVNNATESNYIVVTALKLRLLLFLYRYIWKTLLTLELTDKNTGSNNSWSLELGDKVLPHPKILCRRVVKNEKTLLRLTNKEYCRSNSVKTLGISK